jgi:hypothetical protein
MQVSVLVCVNASLFIATLKCYIDVDCLGEEEREREREGESESE